MPKSNQASEELLQKIAVLQRAYEREKTRREYAEKMLEDKSRDLYLSKKELTDSDEALTNANDLLRNKDELIDGLSTNYDRVTQDLSYAARVQNSLLPGPLELPAVSAIGEFKPAQFIAGDGYDYFKLDENILAFYVVDVAGHGIAAAMTSFAIQVQLNPKQDGLCLKHYSTASTLNDIVSKTMDEINQIFFHEHPDSQYFTMIYGLLDLKSGDVSFAQAGHPPPILWKAQEGLAEPQGKGGTPVAMFDTPSFGIYQCHMEPGDRLLIYSDGVTECRDKNDEEFGTDKLIECMCKCSTQPIKQSTECLTRAVASWNGSDVFEDDLSILLIEYRES